MRKFLVIASLALAASAAPTHIAGATPPVYLGEWGSMGSGSGQFLLPLGIAVSNDGIVYVSDGFQSRIQKFSANGTYVLEWTVYDGSGAPAQCDRPRVDATGNVYVVTHANPFVQVFDGSGGQLRCWGTSGNDPGDFSLPIDVAVRPDGDLVFSDFGRNRIQRFEPDSSFVSEFGSTGSGPGQFNGAHGVAVDVAGNVYVTDLGNLRVQKFDAAGGFVTQWGSLGSWPGQFRNITGITVDDGGFLYVADGGNNRIQQFTLNGAFVREWGSFGSGAGKFNSPNGVAIGPDGTIYVLDQNNHRVQMFGELPVPLIQASWGEIKNSYR